jgi:signal transduction histidine kinase
MDRSKANSIKVEQDSRARIEDLLMQAESLHSHGDLSKSLALCEQCILDLEKFDHADREAQLWQSNCYQQMGRIHLEQQDWLKARELLDRASAGYETLEDGHQLATTIGLTGQCWLGVMDLERAMECFRQAAHLWEREGVMAEAGLSWLELALCLAHAGEIRAASLHVQQGLYRVDSAGELCFRIRARRISSNVFAINGLVEEQLEQLEALTGLLDSENQQLKSNPNTPSTSELSLQSLDHAYHEAIRTFTSKAAHDMKEPLRMIGSFSTLLKRNYGSVLDAEGNEFLDIVSDANERMGELLSKLLEFSRLGVQAIEQGQSVVELMDVAVLATHHVRETVLASQAKVDVLALPTIMGNSAILQQMLIHLLDNALKFNSNKNPQIRIEGKEDSGMAVLTVHDNGIGIPEGHRKEVFDLFRRLYARSEYRGSGIGLAIVNRVAELHGGYCEITDSPLGGSAFQIYLPALQN